MGKILKIGFVLIIAGFLLGGGIVGAGKARAVEYREGECIKDDSSCNLSDCGVKNIYGKDYGCLSGYACGLYSPESGGQKNTCIKLLEGETLLIQTSRPTDLNLCIEETGGMGIRNSVEKRGLPPEAYTFQIFGNQFIMCQSGYECLDQAQCVDENEYNQITSGSLECVIDDKTGEAGGCVGKYFSGGKYTPCTTNSGNNGCLKSKICTDSLQCTPLMNNECIPGTTDCRGDAIDGACKNKKSIGEGQEYAHGCLEDKVNDKKSLCIQQGDASGGCTEMIDFSSYDSIQQAGVYYNQEGLPFICGDNEADLQKKDDKQTYVVISSTPATTCPNFSYLQFKEKIEWDKDVNAYKTQKSGKYLSDATEKPEIQTLLQSQCIGPLADGCKGKSAVQQFLTSTFGNVIITILSVIFGLAHTLFGILLALIMSVMGWVLSSFDVTAVSALSTFWAYIRDLCNLLFIVILLYIAFATVLRINAGQVKKMLPSFLLAAILINFS
ncbi:CPBP family intramembrane metalloprotease, partial [Patescibacteria group bacterium]|nr:CPBP family intramembrane metalloprotease [Patescibacteria group bacterium]